MATGKRDRFAAVAKLVEAVPRCVPGHTVGFPASATIKTIVIPAVGEAFLLTLVGFERYGGWDT